MSKASGRVQPSAPLAAARLGDERGAGLVEVLVAVAITGTAVVALLAAISTGSVAVATSEQRLTAQNLARSQIEYTKSQAYIAAPAAYATVTPPPGYAVAAQATSIPGGDGDIQQITVTVTRYGATLSAVETYKVDR